MKPPDFNFINLPAGNYQIVFAADNNTEVTVNGVAQVSDGESGGVLNTALVFNGVTPDGNGKIVITTNRVNGTGQRALLAVILRKL